MSDLKRRRRNAESAKKHREAKRLEIEKLQNTIYDLNERFISLLVQNTELIANNATLRAYNQMLTNRNQFLNERLQSIIVCDCDIYKTPHDYLVNEHSEDSLTDENPFKENPFE